jgi:hypothetical protein
VLEAAPQAVPAPEGKGRYLSIRRFGIDLAIAPVLVMADMAAAVAVLPLATVIVAAITTVVSIIAIGGRTHVVAQRTACATASGSAYQATCATGHATAHHVATGSAQGATNGSLASAVLVGADGTAGRTTQACANRRACAAAQLLADHCT